MPESNLNVVPVVKEGFLLLVGVPIVQDDILTDSEGIAMKPAVNIQLKNMDDWNALLHSQVDAIHLSYFASQSECLAILDFISTNPKAVKQQHQHSREK